MKVPTFCGEPCISQQHLVSFTPFHSFHCAIAAYNCRKPVRPPPPVVGPTVATFSHTEVVEIGGGNDASLAVVNVAELQGTVKEQTVRRTCTSGLGLPQRLTFWGDFSWSCGISSLYQPCGVYISKVLVMLS